MTTIQVKLPEIERFKIRAMSLPFELEDTFPGVSLLQGVVGGMLSALIYIVIVSLYFQTILLALYMLIAIGIGGMYGFFVTVPLWAIYRLTGIRMTAPVRIPISTISLTLLLAVFRYPFIEVDLYKFANAALVCVLPSLPVALLVGSRVRPWGFIDRGGNQ